MSRRAASTAAAGSVALHLALGAALAQAPVRLGGEFQINTLTAFSQYSYERAVALENDGDFVVVWRSSGQDGDSGGVFGRRYSSSGAAIGLEFQVNTYTISLQSLPAVATDGDGDFVVAWASFRDGSNFGVFAQRFGSSGAALGAEFQVNLYTNSSQSGPKIAREANGDFVVAWRSDQDGSGEGIFARRFGAGGVAQGGELQVNSLTAGNQTTPALDLDDNGDFVVAWGSPDDGSGSGVFAQRFNSSGAKQGPEFQANLHFTGAQQRPAVALDANGDFVIAWQSDDLDGSLNGIAAQRFDSSGTPLGAELRVNSNGADDQTRPTLGIDSDGDFVVAWESINQDGSSWGVFARHFRASGVPTTTDDIAVNTTVAGNQRFAAVDANAGGDFVVAWSSVHDGLGYGIFGQRFDVPALLDIDGDGQLTALSDGLLVLRFLFGFTGATLTSGAVGLDCTRCSNAAILAYLQSLT